MLTLYKHFVNCCDVCAIEPIVIDGYGVFNVGDLVMPHRGNKYDIATGLDHLVFLGDGVRTRIDFFV